MKKRSQGTCTQSASAPIALDKRTKRTCIGALDCLTWQCARYCPAAARASGWIAQNRVVAAPWGTLKPTAMKNTQSRMRADVALLWSTITNLIRERQRTVSIASIVDGRTRPYLKGILASRSSYRSSYIWCAIELQFYYRNTKENTRTKNVRHSKEAEVKTIKPRNSITARHLGIDFACTKLKLRSVFVPLLTHTRYSSTHMCHKTLQWGNY